MLVGLRGRGSGVPKRLAKAERGETSGTGSALVSMAMRLPDLVMATDSPSASQPSTTGKLV